MELNELKPYIDTLTYDKYYQDINCIGFTGYSESSKTWETLKNAVPWAGKTIADLGCFHGYFSFQIAKMGGIVTALDKSAMVIETTNIINEFEGNIIKTGVWEDGQPLPRFDIVLILNVLHHFKDPDATLRDMDCDIGIFEINEDMKPIVEKYFVVNKVLKSHRENRIILVARKCHPVPDEVFKEKKLFVTGIYASGKSDYAKAYAAHYGLPYIDFDANFSYDKTKKESSEDVIYNMFKGGFIIDAIPFNLMDGSTKRFFDYARDNAIRIICVVCTNKDEWERRVEEVKGVNMSPMRYHHYHSFYYGLLPGYFEFEITYYDTFTNEYITQDQLYERISWLKTLLGEPNA